MPSKLQIKPDSKNGLFVFDKRVLRRAFAKAGAEVSAVAKTLIRRSRGGRVYRGSGGTSGGFRPYKSGSYQASIAGAAPANVTRTLINSIKVKPYKSGEGVAVRAAAFYAVILEGGAKGGRTRKSGTRKQRAAAVGTRIVLPRPFLSAALDQRAASLTARIKAVVDQGVAFTRQKP